MVRTPTTTSVQTIHRTIGADFAGCPPAASMAYVSGVRTRTLQRADVIQRRFFEPYPAESNRLIMMLTPFRGAGACEAPP
jgi:hypothetical protein